MYVVEKFIILSSKLCAFGGVVVIIYLQVSDHRHLKPGGERMGGNMRLLNQIPRSILN